MSLVNRQRQKSKERTQAQSQAQKAYDKSKAEYRHNLIEIDQFLYKQGRRFTHTKHQKAFEKWKSQYNKANQQRREKLLKENRERFKSFIAERKSGKHNDYSYQITQVLEESKNNEFGQLASKFDDQLNEYFLEHFQYFFSLSLKDQFDVLIDRFEWILHEPTMFLIDRILYQDPSRNPYLMGNYAPV